MPDRDDLRPEIEVAVDDIVHTVDVLHACHAALPMPEWQGAYNIERDRLRTQIKFAIGYLESYLTARCSICGCRGVYKPCHHRQPCPCSEADCPDCGAGGGA